MDLLHITSPDRALAILRTGKYAGETIQSDNGLNTYLLHNNKIAQPTNSNLDARGVRMIFIWNGQVQTGTAFQPNVAYDLRPHRIFIPVGTTQDLTLKDCILEEGHSWSEAIGQPSGMLDSIKAKISKSAWETCQLEKIESEIAALRQNPKAISIVQRWW